MKLYPAIDLKDGKAVRLQKGDMAKATIFHDDPAAQALDFVKAGCEYLHLVDLDGAFSGRPENAAAVEDILKAVSVPVQLGGGIRSLETIDRWLQLGVSRVILGTAAVKNPALVKAACQQFPGRILVGIDARNGFVATEGWAETSDLPAADLARRFEDVGVEAIIFTDIDRDGMMMGVNWQAVADLARAVRLPIIASGGVRGMDDIMALCATAQAAADGIKGGEMPGGKVDGVVIGRALYDGAVDLRAALQLVSASC
ncbi:1-(5-phosphoribosyl)-5-[(5-phosphoribosylamino)methylideneamino] imidazole-4-carboxamide isomerase [alpha proteobacterium Q-1]|nr:1-(5-phosphoribosyl)-5-[(5-phosphoribosylamino)methylideneamino] imidazole-4-carboxamide isomerase [alpha proteobacterium Q-1]